MNKGASFMNIRKATVNDIDLLIKLRLDYIRADSGDITASQEEAIRMQLNNYMPKHLAAGDLIAILAEQEGIIASSAFLVIVEKPANLSFITGKTGTLLNVFTYPEYRRRGLASQVVLALIDEAKKSDVLLLELLATNDGKPMYDKLKFKIPSNTYMRLSIETNNK
jgi:GNAT superfamily N-acetyltransferase